MCGIIGYIPTNTKNETSGKKLVEQYQRQLGRGQKGFGLISIFPNEIVIDRATEPTKIVLDAYMSKAPIQFLHHRYPTSTDNAMEQTHPFVVEHDELAYDYCLIHNGVISNDDALFKTHTEELGYRYKSLTQTKTGYYNYNKFNDSEALAIECARYFDGKSDVINALGSIAFVMVRIDKTTKVPVDIIWSRSATNPIEFNNDSNGLLIASEIQHDNAESLEPDTFEVINLKKYFKKAKHKDIYSLLKNGKVNYAVRPVVVTPTVTRAITSPTTVQVGFKDDERETKQDRRNNYTTKRELAFIKMADRVIYDINEEIYAFFENLAYFETNEAEITELANSLMDLLIEKAEISKTKVRPFFEKQEEDSEGEILGSPKQYLLDNDDADWSDIQKELDDQEAKDWNASFNKAF